MRNSIEIFTVVADGKPNTLGVYEFDKKPDGPFCFRGGNERVITVDLREATPGRKGKKVKVGFEGFPFYMNEVSLNRNATGYQTIGRDLRLGVMFANAEGVTKPERSVK